MKESRLRVSLSLLAALFVMESAWSASVTPLPSSFVTGSHLPSGAVVSYPSSGFEWGDYDPGAGDFLLPSYFQYDDSIPAPVTPSTGFDVGQFQYFNGSSEDTGGATNVTFKLNVDIDSIPTSFLFSMSISNTFNTLDAIASRDTVIATSLPLIGATYDASISFVLASSFEPGEALDNAFSVDEFSGATARLILTLVPTGGGTGVPDGGSTLALLGSAFASLSVWRRNRR